MLQTGGTLWSEIGVLFSWYLDILIYCFQKFQQVSYNFHRLVYWRGFIMNICENILKIKDWTNISIVLQISPQQKLRSSWNFMWWWITILWGYILNFIKIRAWVVNVRECGSARVYNSCVRIYARIVIKKWLQSLSFPNTANTYLSSSNVECYLLTSSSPKPVSEVIFQLILELFRRSLFFIYSL